MVYRILSLTVVCAGLFLSCNSSTNTTRNEVPVDSNSLSDISFSEIDSVHTSQNALDWAGTYEGTIPCADCPGIKTTVVLHPDETFSLTSEYLERDTKIEDKGAFMWHNNGSTVHLKSNDTDVKLKVGENQLFYLDQEGKMIDGPNKEYYILRKK